MPIHIFLTGKPRTGKTTLIKKIVKGLKQPCGGFYTEEISKEGKRTGFAIKTLDGKEGILAMKGFKSRFHLGKYGIHIKDLEEIGVRAVEGALRNKDFIIIDEIGKMELFSQKFKDIVLKALDSGKRLIGVIHSADLEFLKAIKSRRDVVILEVDLSNHEEIMRKVISLISSS